MGGNGALEEFRAEIQAFGLAVVMLREKRCLSLGYAGTVPLMGAELVWVITSAGGKPARLLW